MNTSETPNVNQSSCKHTFLTSKILFGIFLVSLVFIAFSVLINQKNSQNKLSQSFIPSSARNIDMADTLKTFSSDEEFTTVFSTKHIDSGTTMRNNAGSTLMMQEDAISKKAPISGGGSAERVSGTNVQVFGIDEPDIVKTDGSTIYYAKEPEYMLYSQPELLENQSILPSAPINKIVGVSALPVSNMKLRSSIPETGEMLIQGSTLIVFGQSQTGSLTLTGYSIKNPNTPKRVWQLPFHQRISKVGARLYNKSIYLVVSILPSLPRPCPLPLLDGQQKVSIKCMDVFYPSSQPSVDTVYTVLKINTETGSVDKTLSFSGNSNNTVLYVSREALYLTYFVEGDMIEIMGQFIEENKGVLPSFIESKIAKLRTYDLASSTKYMELSTILQQYMYSLDENSRLTLENNLKNTISQFANKYKRAFEYTGIEKVQLSSMTLVANGKVPGRLLNQFSLDEWKGNVRAATTLSMTGIGSVFPWGIVSNQDSVSDVYVLDEELNRIGSVKDLGKTERIYSVRFIADRGYVVTFRETDPLYVLDLSVPSAPQVKGELKIPGYSSYLHPLDTYLLLGIGKEGLEVKLSLFNTKDAHDPKEIAKYTLSQEYWSEALSNHHAFLQDAKYSVFFLPGSRGGYIFSYENNDLSLVKAISGYNVKRSLYLNDAMYIVSNSGITAFQEGTWDKVGEYTFIDARETNPSDVQISQ